MERALERWTNEGGAPAAPPADAPLEPPRNRTRTLSGGRALPRPPSRSR
jgi:hypothetical protein